MADQFAFFFDGVEADLAGFDRDAIQRSASRAINTITRSTRGEIADEIRRTINVPASYVSNDRDRLYISRFASEGDLESEIVARGRATSLARFVTGSKKVGQAGVSVSIKSGKSGILNRAFLLPLRRGFGPETDGPSNLGLAIRLRKGESLSKTTAAKRLGNNLYLLYGLSIAQVFENNAGKGVKSDYSPEIERRLQQEFIRLMEREGLA